MTYAYLRVSTNHQDLQNQKHGIEKWCINRHIHIDEFINDHASGKIDPRNRNLGKQLELMNKNDVLICSELSRLGRSLFMIIKILEDCMNRGIKVYSIKEGYELGNNITSKVMAFAFGISAEIERDLISQRTKEALQRKRAQGYILGRTAGTRCRLNPNCSINHDKLILWLETGIGKREIARRLGINLNTLYRYLTYTGLHVPKTNRGKPWQGGIYR